MHILPYFSEREIDEEAMKRDLEEYDDDTQKLIMKKFKELAMRDGKGLSIIVNIFTYDNSYCKRGKGVQKC